MVYVRNIAFIALFAFMVLSAVAQDSVKISDEEKSRILEELERNYEMEIYGYFSFDQPAKALNLMPWDTWAYQYRDEYQRVSELFGCLENLSVEPVEGEPKMCRLVFRGKSKDTDTFHNRKYIGNPWQSHIDSLGTYIGFREKIFYGLTTDVEIHLTNKNGKPILADLDFGSMECVYAIEGKKSIGNGESEVCFGIDIPLDSEFSEISDGTLTVRFAMPDEYDIVKIEADDGCKMPVQVSFKDFNFKIEKIDSIGFVISADIFNRTKTDKTNCLFRKDAIWYEPRFAVGGWGYLEDILEYNGGDYTFGQWLEKKGIDSENLRETMREYRRAADSYHSSPDIFGKHYRTGMSADAILFYKPSATEDERIFSESTVRITPSGHKSSYITNKALRSALLEKLKLMQKNAEDEENGDEEQSNDISIWESVLGDEPDIVETKDTAANSTIENKEKPNVQYFQPEAKNDVLNPIVYGLCYTTAYGMFSREFVDEKTYRKEYARHVHAGYDFGVKHWKELVRMNFSSLWHLLVSVEETTIQEKLCFHSGALMGAYSTNPDPELEYIDAAISDVLKQEKNYKSTEDDSRQEYYSLYNEWMSFILKEQERYNDIARHNRPDFLIQEHAEDALIRPEWIDSATVDSEVSQSEALASAIAKFDSPAAPDGIRKLKDNMKLTPYERNALVAPNDMISYAVGVAQADWIMEYEWFIGEAHREEFDAMLLSPGNRTAIIAAFEDGLRSAMTLTERFKNAILCQDCDSICLMNKAIKTELSKAYRQGVVYGYVFMNGMDAVEIYRAGAEWDIPEKQMASGLRLDNDRVLEGFRDYLDGHLKMGVEYARTLTRGRNAIDWHLYEKDTKTADLSENGFQPAVPLAINTGIPSELSAELSKMITLPQEVAGQNITGKVMTAVVIEADGAVSKVEITSSPHPALSETVTDSIYRMRFKPAKYCGECVASVAVIPVSF